MYSTDISHKQISIERKQWRGWADKLLPTRNSSVDDKPHDAFVQISASENFLHRSEIFTWKGVVFRFRMV